MHHRAASLCEPTRLSALLMPVQQLACGEDFCVALMQNGLLFSWGDGEEGKLGLGRPEAHERPTMVDFLLPTAYAEVAKRSQNKDDLLKAGSKLIKSRGRQFQVTALACGARHTLALASSVRHSASRFMHLSFAPVAALDSPPRVTAGTSASAAALALSQRVWLARATISTSAQFCHTCALCSQSQRQESTYAPGSRSAGTSTVSRMDHSQMLFPYPLYAEAAPRETENCVASGQNPVAALDSLPAHDA